MTEGTKARDVPPLTLEEAQALVFDAYAALLDAAQTAVGLDPDVILEGEEPAEYRWQRSDGVSITMQHPRPNEVSYLLQVPSDELFVVLDNLENNGD